MKSSGARDELVREVQNDSRPQQGLSPGFCLIGLVPIGVGVAYLVTYRVERKNKVMHVQRE